MISFLYVVCTFEVDVESFSGLNVAHPQSRYKASDSTKPEADVFELAHVS